MPKKQKQKQSQKTSVVVNVGASKKGVSRRPRTAPTPMARNPQSISVVLQGSAMNLPAPLTNDYNTIIQQLSNIQRQQAASGSLIPNMGRNDLLNRVQATNPFTSRSTNTQAEMLNPDEGAMEEIVESGTTSNSYDNNSYDAQVPIDQDFIRNTRIKRFGQTLGGNTYKIGVGDAETVSDLTAYDDEDLEDSLASSVAGTKGSSKRYSTEENKSDSDIFSRGVTPLGKKASAMAATSKLIGSMGTMTPTPKETPKERTGIMPDYEIRRLEAIKKAKQREYNKTYREKMKAKK